MNKLEKYWLQLRPQFVFIMLPTRRILAAATTSARLTYPVRPPAGMLSGRVVDGDHWRKVETIFPVERWSAETSLLADANEAVRVDLADGRASRPTLQAQGFQLFEAPTAAADFDVPGSVDAYRSETVELLSRIFPEALCVVPFHSLIRDSRRDNLDSSKGPKSFADQAHAPVERVHGDYTDRNAPLRLAELTAQGLVPAGGRSYAIVNTWRSVSPAPVLTKPLAVLDAGLAAPEDLFPYALVHGDKVGYNNAIAFDPKHTWTYFPAMTKDEVLVFFTFDGTRSPPRYVFHTAFDLDEEDGPPRHSIEVRSLVVL